MVTEVLSNLGNATCARGSRFPMWIPSHRKRDSPHYKDSFITELPSNV